MLFAVPAVADPGTGGAADDVAAVSARLAAVTARAQAADLALSVAAENYDEAAVELARAEAEARRAGAAAAHASRRLDDARADAGRLAAQAYRDGGTLGPLAAALSPGGPDDVLERAALLRVLGDQRRHTLREVDAARVVATSLQRQAEQAIVTHRAAAQRLARTRHDAEQRATAAAQTAAATAAERDGLLARLARLRRASTGPQGPATQQPAPQAPVRQQPPQPTRPAQTAPAAPAVPASPAPARTELPAPRRTERPAPTRAPEPSRRPPPGSSSGSSSGGAAAVAWAKRQVGIPYRWGGDGPDDYDCSGLTMRAWQRAGVSLPHSSRLQYRLAAKVSHADLRPGDLLFFATDPSDPGTIHHVAMYAGGGQMVEAPSSGLRVRVVPVRRSDAMPYAGRP